MPRIEEILDCPGSARIFTMLNAFSDYHKVRILESDIEKTAFSCKMGSFEFTRMLFGLVNGPVTFQRMMDSVLKEEL